MLTASYSKTAFPRWYSVSKLIIPSIFEPPSWRTNRAQYISMSPALLIIDKLATMLPVEIQPLSKFNARTYSAGRDLAQVYVFREMKTKDFPP